MIGDDIDELLAHEDEDASLDDDFIELQHVADDIISQQLTHSVLANYGVNPATVMILQGSNTKTGSFLDSVAIESLSFHSSSDAYNRIAMESLVDSIREKIRTWSAKILSTFANMTKSIMEKATTLYNAMKTRFDNTIEHLQNFTGDSVNKIQGTDSKTIIAALTAALAVIAVVVFGTKSLMSLKDAGKLPGVQETMAGMINKIKWPFGQFQATTVKNKLVISAIGAATLGTTAASLTRMEWSAPVVDKVCDLCDKVFVGLKTVWTRGVEPTADAVISNVAYVGKNMQTAYVGGQHQGGGTDERTSAQSVMGLVTGGLSAFIAGTLSIIHVIAKLLKSIVIGAFRLTNLMFDKLGDLGSSSSKTYV